VDQCVQGHEVTLDMLVHLDGDRSELEEVKEDAIRLVIVLASIHTGEVDIQLSVDDVLQAVEFLFMAFQADIVVTSQVVVQVPLVVTL